MLSLADDPIYSFYSNTERPWGVTVMADQQLAGLIMWAPAAGLYLGAALVLVHRLLTRGESRLAS